MLTPDEAFFYEHAGSSHDPKKETEQQGRERGARNLAAAEAAARRNGFSFEWSVDEDLDSSEFSDARPPWKLWVCVARNGQGRIIDSLSGIDFGRDGDPWGQPYKRVVEAQVAMGAQQTMDQIRFEEDGGTWTRTDVPQNTGGKFAVFFEGRQSEAVSDVGAAMRCAYELSDDNDGVEVAVVCDCCTIGFIRANRGDTMPTKMAAGFYGLPEE